MRHNDSSRIRHATRWSGLEISVRYVVQFGVMIALARLIEPGAFGVVAMVLAFTALGTVFVDSGTGLALIQKQRTTADEETSVFMLNLAIGVAMALLLIASGPAIAAFYGHPELTRLSMAMAAIFPLNALAVVPDALLTQRMAFQTRTRVEMGSSLASGGIAIAAAWAGWGAWALVLQALSSIAARVVMLYTASGWRPTGHFHRDAARSVTRFGTYMLAAGLIDTAYTRLQAVLIGRLFSARDLGFYTLAQNTQQAPASFIASVVNRLGLPLLSSVRSDARESHRILRSGMRLGLFLFAPAMAALSVLAAPIVTLVYGDAWMPAGELLGILALAAIPWPAHVLNLVALNSQGHPHLVLRVEILKKSTGILLLVASAPFGLSAIAWSTVATSVLASFFNAACLGRVTGYGVRAQAADYGSVFIATIGAAGAAWLCRLYVPGTLSCVVAGCTAAGIVTMLAGVASGHPAIPTVRQILRGGPK